MHKPVLLQEIIEGLSVKDGEIFVDATVGNAGHTRAIIETGIKNSIVIAVDADKSAIKNAKENLLAVSKSHHILFENAHFDSLPNILEKNNISKIDKIIFDLGFRSDQVDDPERGFSFLKEGPLDMSFQTETDEYKLTAEEIVNEWQEDSLSDIIKGFGEEKFSDRIAKAIVEERSKKRITKTTELVEIIEKSVPVFYRRKKIHPATKTFQALRIAVNQELDRLRKVLPFVFEKLSTDGRIAVISFHSLEDRIVKNFFREKAKSGQAELINKKPIIATHLENTENPRARSAKLRIIKKI